MNPNVQHGLVTRTGDRAQARTGDVPRFSQAAGALVVALVLGSPAAGGGDGALVAQEGGQGPERERAAAEGDALAEPPLLRDRSPAPDTVEVTLIASPARLSLLPGTETDVFTYNGGVPGPTLEAREGDRVIVRFRNELPEQTTVHWHGLHVPVHADGSPIHPVEPGEEYTYEFTLPPGTAGTYWYHPHPHHRTGYQVGKGLYGALIVRDPADPIPPEVTEKLLILADNRFRPDGSLDFAEPGTRQARMDEKNGREGDVLFVNGQIAPTVRIRSGEVQRWRLINASAARVYRLALPGHTFLHVGSDGGLFEKPREVEEILVANSERVELLVRGTGQSGDAVVLQSLPYDRYLPQTRPKDWEGKLELLTLQYTEDAPVDPVTVPDRLRRIPILDPADADTVRTIVMTQGRIDGQLFDPGRVDQVAALGATEIWEVENWVGMDHPFHLHGFQFQVVERGGEPVAYRSWEDTVNVPKRGSVKFIVRFADHPGKWMFHCHILDHEDDGMMGILEVR